MDESSSNEAEEMDWSLVVVFDIVGYSEHGNEPQAELVQEFTKRLNEKLRAIDHLGPDAFGTGDGAIVSIGRNCTVDKSATRDFLDFVVDCTKDMMDGGPSLTVSVNYSERDKVVHLDDPNYLQGDFIQVGDTINDATRLLNFCEPGEIMMSYSVYKLLERWGLNDEYDLHPNDPIVTKHGQRLDSYTYDPADRESDVLYSPDNIAHKYKKYRYFPPVDPTLLRDFDRVNLETEVRNVVSNTYEAVMDLKETRSFVSLSGVLEILMQCKYDEDDEVYVVSRRDRNSNFWTQPRKDLYIDYLQNIAKNHDGTINQKRVRVYDASTDKGGFLENEEDDIRHKLEPLHGEETYYSCPAHSLLGYDDINELIFGCTISTKYHYVIIPVPPMEAMAMEAGASRPDLRNLGNTLAEYENYDVADGPMKAIIRKDEEYVNTLVREIDELLEEPEVTRLK